MCVAFIFENVLLSILFIFMVLFTISWFPAIANWEEVLNFKYVFLKGDDGSDYGNVKTDAPACRIVLLILLLVMKKKFQYLGRRGV